MDRVNQWLSLMANVGVVAGIVFLAVETQQNTVALNETRNLAIAQAQQERQSALDESYRSLANSDLLPAIFVKYDNGGREALSEEELRRFIWQSCSGLNRLDTLHAWYERGYVEEEEFDVTFKRVVMYFAPRWRDIGIWPVRPPFREAVERLLRDAGEPLPEDTTTAC